MRVKTFFMNDWKYSVDNYGRFDEYLAKGQSPIMSSFCSEEIDYWYLNLREYVLPSKPIVELACARGRVLEKLKISKLDCFGVDTNPHMVFHCRDLGFEAEVVKLGQPTPEVLKEKFQAAVFSMNNLFDYPAEQSDEWIKVAADALPSGGLMMFSAYANNKLVEKYTDQRVKFYSKCFAQEEYRIIHHINTKERRGIRLFNHKTNEEEWFSEWFTKQDLLKKIRPWEKYFNLERFELLPCQIAHVITMVKK
jgi:hypothetical protein